MPDNEQSHKHLDFLRWWTYQPETRRIGSSDFPVSGSEDLRSLLLLECPSRDCDPHCLRRDSSHNNSYYHAYLASPTPITYRPDDDDFSEPIKNEFPIRYRSVSSLDKDMWGDNYIISVSNQGVSA